MKRTIFLIMMLAIGVGFTAEKANASQNVQLKVGDGSGQIVVDATGVPQVTTLTDLDGDGLADDITFGGVTHVWNPFLGMYLGDGKTLVVIFQADVNSWPSSVVYTGGYSTSGGTFPSNGKH